MILDWLTVLVCVPGSTTEHAGILLLDKASNRLFVRLKTAPTDWPEDFAMVWDSFAEELNQLSTELGGDEAMAWLETTASNSIQVSDRQSFQAENIIECLDSLYLQHVQAQSRVAGSAS